MASAAKLAVWELIIGQHDRSGTGRLDMHEFTSLVQQLLPPAQHGSAAQVAAQIAGSHRCWPAGITHIGPQELHDAADAGAFGLPDGQLMIALQRLHSHAIQHIQHHHHHQLAQQQQQLAQQQQLSQHQQQQLVKQPTNEPVQKLSKHPQKMAVPHLRMELTKRGLTATGSRAELEQRLLSALEGNTSVEGNTTVEVNTSGRSSTGMAVQQVPTQAALPCIVTESTEKRTDRRYHWPTTDGMSLEDFLQRVQPSLIGSAVDWICVHNNKPGSPEFGVEGEVFRQSDYEHVSALPLPHRREAILRAAHANSLRCGKWMLSPTVEQVDEWWGRIARATADGRLGCSAKVGAEDLSGPDGAKTRLICVYGHDFGNRELVMSLLGRLVQEGFRLDCIRGFKPDVFTYLDGKLREWGNGCGRALYKASDMRQYPGSDLSVTKCSRNPTAGAPMEAPSAPAPDTFGMPKWTSSTLQDSAKTAFFKNGVQATWQDVITLLSSPSGRSYWNAALASCPFESFFWECLPLCRDTRDKAFEMVTLDADEAQRKNWNRRLDRSTFDAVREGKGQSQPHAFCSTYTRPDGVQIETRTVLVSPADLGMSARGKGNPVSACKHIGIFVRQAQPEQQQILWREVGAQLQARANDLQPTWVSTDGTGVHWLHIRLSFKPSHYKHEPYAIQRDVRPARNNSLSAVLPKNRGRMPCNWGQSCNRGAECWYDHD